jgi:hypothetical protein
VESCAGVAAGAAAGASWPNDGSALRTHVKLTQRKTQFFILFLFGKVVHGSYVAQGQSSFIKKL